MLDRLPARHRILWFPLRLRVFASKGLRRRFTSRNPPKAHASPQPPPELRSRCAVCAGPGEQPESRMYRPGPAPLERSRPPVRRAIARRCGAGRSRSRSAAPGESITRRLFGLRAEVHPASRQTIPPGRTCGTRLRPHCSHAAITRFCQCSTRRLARSSAQAHHAATRFQRPDLRDAQLHRLLKGEVHALAAADHCSQRDTHRRLRVALEARDPRARRHWLCATVAI